MNAKNLTIVLTGTPNIATNASIQLEVPEARIAHGIGANAKPRAKVVVAPSPDAKFNIVAFLKGDGGKGFSVRLDLQPGIYYLLAGTVSGFGSRDYCVGGGQGIVGRPAYYP